MSLFIPASRTLVRGATLPVARRTLASASQPSKSWLNRWVKPPSRPITAGEYLFILATRTSVAGLGIFCVGIVAPLYILIKRPYPPLMLKRMAELPPADAERLFKRETEPLPPGYRLY